MAKKAKKQNVDKVVKKVNKEFEKTSAQIEKLINEALKQFDGLQNQIQEPVRKLLKELDELRDREMKRFSDEYERRLGEFHELQNNLLDRLGIASKEAKGEAKKVTDKAAQKAPSSKATSAPKKSASTKTTTKKSAAKKSETAKKSAKPKTATAAKSPASASKSSPQKATNTTKKPAAPKRAPKPKDKSDLTQIKGIGPATARKMKEAGITSVDQIANPTAEDQEKLQAFSNVKGFSTFSDEAKKVI